MGKVDAIGLASGSLVAGLISGVSLLTGINIDPTALMSRVAQTMVDLLLPQYSDTLSVFLGILAVVVVLQTIFLILSGLRYGAKGLAMTLFCFFGGLLLLFNNLAIILVIIGGAIARFIEPNNETLY